MTSGENGEDSAEVKAPAGRWRVRNKLTAGAVSGSVIQAGSIGTVAVHHTEPAPRPMPRQLPAAPTGFIGRTDELAALNATLNLAPAGPVISTLAGAGGIGKTWLALHWAHTQCNRFPDGQLFVDLHGFSPAGEPIVSDSAVRGFLDALGITPARIPADADAQAALYRSLVAGKRMLIVLDNVATADQVVPLLPGSPTCTVLITSRHRLASLIDRHNARHLTLDVLVDDDAHALLAARLDADLIAAEPDAVNELVELCAGYPLALSITARNAASRRGSPLAEVAAELRELGLEMLDHETDPAASLPTVLSWSLRRLTDESRTVFQLLGIAPGPDTTWPAVVALTGLPPLRARKALSALEEASLLERRPHSRYAMHDLVHDYAATTADATLADDVLETALIRVMDFHLHTAYAADRLLNPLRPLLHPDPPVPGVRSHPLADAATAMAWLETEHATLLATQLAAVALDRHSTVWHLAWALDTFHFRQGHRRDAVAVWRAALDAASHLPDPVTRSHTHRQLGHSCSRLGLHEEATWHLTQALDLAKRHSDPAIQALTHQAFALISERKGDDRQALEHARRALELHGTLDQPVWKAIALNQVGWYAARLGDFHTAEEHCLAAMALYQHHRNSDGKATTLDSLGFIAYHTGRHQQALEHYSEALTLLRSLDHADHVADTLDSVGHPYAALGQHERAREVWQAALELYREQGRDTDAARIQHQLDDLGATQP